MQINSILKYAQTAFTVEEIVQFVAMLSQSSTSTKEAEIWYASSNGPNKMKYAVTIILLYPPPPSKQGSNFWVNN